MLSRTEKQHTKVVVAFEVVSEGTLTCVSIINLKTLKSEVILLYQTANTRS